MTAPDHEKKLKDLNKVLAITRAMGVTVDLDSLLKLIIDRSMELLDCERATLFLYDRGRDELYSRIAAGEEEIRFPANRGIAGSAVKSGQTIDVPDAYSDPRFNPKIDRATGFRTRNILTVPLRDYDDQLVGVLQVLNKRGGAFDDYDISLAETLAAQAGVIVQRSRLIDHYIEKQEMERAMRIARDIQQGLLPDAAPDIPGFDLAGLCHPADATGGDTYDFFALPDDRWMIVVADATGHGVGPALVIAETRAMLRAVSRGGSDVGGVLKAVNELLTEDLGDSRFVTCFFGVLDPGDASLTYASAGHGPMLFYDRAADTFQQRHATAIPLGLMGDVDYTEVVTYRLAPGDLAVITTDGFFEAVDPHDNQFGVDRMIELLRRDRDLSPDQMIENLHLAILEFTHNQPQSDDLTAVVIKKSRSEGLSGLR